MSAKKNEFTEMVKTQARPLARPSAAAAGFGTMGMSDKQVIDKVMENRQKPDEEDAESNASSSSQCGSPKSSTSSTTSSTSSGASSSDEDDTKDMKPNPAQKNVELEVKAGHQGQGLRYQLTSQARKRDLLQSKYKNN